MNKRLSHIIEQLNECILDEFRQNLNCSHIETSITHADKYDIEVYLDFKGIIKVDIINSEYERYYTNIESYIADNIIGWNGLESEEYDERDNHGFSSEEDYIRWKYA